MMVYKKLQRLAGFTARVVELLEAVEARGEAGGGESTVPPEASSVGARCPLRSEEYGVAIRPRHRVRTGRQITGEGCEFRARSGENLFVTGANGAGKTSLFRVLAGLWKPSSGTVYRPDVTSDAADGFRVFYVPQRPYLVNGSLRDQVMYPLPGDSARDADVLEALSRVNLLKLVRANPRGLDRAPHDWADVLSGGEKQRVGLARLYFHKPRYAVLDEATSAINPDEEGRFTHTSARSHHRVFHRASDGAETISSQAPALPRGRDGRMDVEENQGMTSVVIRRYSSRGVDARGASRELVAGENPPMSQEMLKAASNDSIPIGES